MAGLSVYFSNCPVWLCAGAPTSTTELLDKQRPRTVQKVKQTVIPEKCSKKYKKFLNFRQANQQKNKVKSQILIHKKISPLDSIIKTLFGAAFSF